MVAARELTYAAARAKDLGKRCDIEAGMAKLLAARTAWSNADAALHAAKSEGRNDLRFYSPGMNDRILPAIGLRLLSVVFFAAMNASIKLAEHAGASVVEILFFRQFGAALLVSAVIASALPNR